jgi:thymidylate synthase
MKVKVRVSVTEVAELEMTHEEVQAVRDKHQKSTMENLFVADIFVGRNNDALDRQDIGGDYSFEILSIENTDDEYLAQYIEYLHESKGQRRSYKESWNPMSFQEFKKGRLSECHLVLPKISKDELDPMKHKGHCLP